MLRCTAVELTLDNPPCLSDIAEHITLSPEGSLVCKTPKAIDVCINCPHAEEAENFRVLDTQKLLQIQQMAKSGQLMDCSKRRIGF